MKVKKNYFKSKYRPAGMLINVNAMIYLKFKSQLNVGIINVTFLFLSIFVQVYSKNALF